MGVFQMTAAGLDIQNVNKIYQSKSGNVFALDQINLQVKPKEFVSLLGTSGCGKSTLLNMLSGILPVSGGKIFFDDQDVHLNTAAKVVPSGKVPYASNSELFENKAS